MITVQVQVPDLMRKPLLSHRDMEDLVCYPALLTAALCAGWIKPIAKTGDRGQGVKLYSRNDADALLARLLGGEMPPSPTRKRGEAQP
jgi:hypothetical protein